MHAFATAHVRPKLHSQSGIFVNLTTPKESIKSAVFGNTSPFMHVKKRGTLQLPLPSCKAADCEKM